MRAVLNGWHDLTLGGSIRAKLVGDHSSGWAALLAQETPQQALGRFGITPRLDDLVEDVPILVDSPPEPMLLAGNRDHNLVEVPDIVAVWRLAPETASVRRPELQRPAANRLVGDNDAALEQHLLNQSQAQREPKVQPDRMGDDLGWKAMAFVANGPAHAGSSTPLDLMSGLT
jgi:hypothetical protein